MMAQPEFGDAGQTGTSGVSGASGQITNATSEGQEQMSVAMADTENRRLLGQVSQGEDGKFFGVSYDPETGNPLSFSCQCGKTFDSAQGLQMHKTRWCKE